MKAQYVGDIGDFGKVLILKHLARLHFKIGINWVLTGNDDRADGRHRDYADYKGRDCLCSCDPSVFEGIIPLAQKERADRTIHDLERIVRQHCGEVPFYSGRFTGGSARALSDHNAFNSLSSAELVFFDPDNGISLAAGASEKHVYIPDLQRYSKRGQSLLIYHHLSRSEGHNHQITRMKAALEDELKGSKVFSYRLCRGTARAYFLCVQPLHQERIAGRDLIWAIAPLEMPKAEWARKGKCCSRDHCK
jgi:hypothetical protein